MPTRHHDPLLLAIAQRIKARRVALGWTQEQLSERLGIATKNLQRLERGGENPTILRLQRVSDLLGCTVRDLLDPSDVRIDSVVRRMPLRTTRLVAAGWEIHDEESAADGIPIYDLRERPRNGQYPRLVGWGVAPGARDLDPDTWFLAQMHGNAMAPRIQDRDWCLFRRPGRAPWLGKIVLVETPEAWLVRRIAAVELPVTGGLQMRLECMDGTNPTPIRAQSLALPTGEADFVAWGEFTEVVA